MRILLVLQAVCVFAVLGQDPVIEGVPIVTNLHEETDVRTQLVCIKCTTAGGQNFEISDTRLPNAPFFDIVKVDTEDFCLYYTPVPITEGIAQYVFQPQYDIPVTCTDSDKNSVTTTVQVRILPNQPPQITSPLADSCNIDAKGTAADTAVHATPITVTDVDPKDTITFTMTTVPASSAQNYELVQDGAGSDNYFIKSKRALSYECSSDVTFYINATDGTHNAVGPIVMSCTVTNKYSTPKLTNTDSILYVSEDTAVNTPIFTFNREPPGEDVTYKLDMSPTSLTGEYFNVAQFTDDLTLIQQLDYETDRTRNIDLTVTADNSFCPTEPQVLNIRVTDANDPPTLGPNNVSVTVYEGNINVATGLGHTDPDVNDEITYSIIKGNNKGYFKIDPATGDISSTLEYDIDADARLAKQQLIVQVQDKKGETATSTVNLNIQDANDNYPVFAPNSTSRTLERSECGRIQNPIGQVWAVDKVDSSFQDNNFVKIIPDSNSYLSVGEDGVILQTAQPPGGSVSVLTINARDEGVYPDRKTTRKPLTITLVGTYCTTTIAVVNTGNGNGGTGGTGTGGGAVVTATTTVIITVTPATTTTTTTAAPCTGFFCSAANVALTVLGSLLGLALLGLLGGLLYRYCCNKPVEAQRTWTPPKKVRPLTPPTPPRAKTPDPPKKVEVERKVVAPPPPPLLRVRRLVPVKQQQSMVKIKKFVPVEQNVRLKQLIPVPGNAPAAPK